MTDHAVLEGLIDEGYLGVLTALWGLSGPPGGDASELMAWLYSVGLCLERHPWLSQRSAHAAFLANATPPLLELPETTLDAFVAELYTMTTDFSEWADFYRFPEIPWRRSALAFLTHLFRSEGIRSRLDRAAVRELDGRIRYVRDVMGTFPEEIPPGMPGRHWWWWDGPPGSVQGVRVGVYLPSHPRRSPLTSPPQHPLRLSLPAESAGCFRGPSPPPAG